MSQEAAKKDDFDVEDKQEQAAEAKRPKAASSAYILYVAEHRQVVAQAEPGLSFGDLAKRVAADWKQLTEDQRRPYDERADEDKKRYEREMAEYSKSETD